MNLRAGRLRHRITIKTRVDTKDGTTGAVAVTWTEFATVMAEIVPLSAREFNQAAQMQSNLAARITIRYLGGVLPSMRIEHGSTVYNIEGVLPDPKSGREWLTLPVSVVVNG